jgi:maltose phosphorylase
MNQYLQNDPWCIIEEGFHENKQLASESIFSLGNGHIGQRANFEEHYSGETMLGRILPASIIPNAPNVEIGKTAIRIQTTKL